MAGQEGREDGLQGVWPSDRQDLGGGCSGQQSGGVLGWPWFLTWGAGTGGVIPRERDEEAGAE